jgi:hypothetical protein
MDTIDAIIKKRDILLAARADVTRELMSIEKRVSDLTDQLVNTCEKECGGHAYVTEYETGMYAGEFRVCSRCGEDE